MEELKFTKSIFYVVLCDERYLKSHNVLGGIITVGKGPGYPIFKTRKEANEFSKYGNWNVKRVVVYFPS